MAAALLLPACFHQLPRMAARGQHREVVEKVARSKRLPRGKAARAWATSLVALGRVEEARAVLLRDFRTDAELKSLVALADLEASEGREGIAAAHYARAASLETDVLAGRRDVCELFRRRAARFLAEDEAIAADLDLRRVAAICPKGQRPQDEAQWKTDRALHARVTAAAKAQARAQRTLAGCQAGACRPPSPDAQAQALSQALAQAREAGPQALREAAGRLAMRLAAEDVAGLLGAELRGELGLDLVTIDELRGWIGEASPGDVVAAADRLGSPAARDYVRLRLSQLGPGYELPGDDAARSTASAVVHLLDLIDDDPAAGTMGWRVFVLLGDMASAAVELTSGLDTARAGRAAAVAEEVAREIDGPGAKGAQPRKGKAAGTGSKGPERKGMSGEAGPRAGAGEAVGPGGGQRGDTGEAGKGGAAGAVRADTAGKTGAGEAARDDRATKPGAAGGAAWKDRSGKPGGGEAGAAPDRSAKSRVGEGTAGSAEGRTGAAGAGREDRSSGAGVPDGPALAEGAGAGPKGGPGREDKALGTGAAPTLLLSPVRGPVDQATLPRLLLLARLRGLGERRDLALAIAAQALLAAQAQRVPAIVELAAGEARRELAAGRPWAALAIARAIPGEPTADVARAAGSALVLERRSCGEACGDADDRAAVRQVFGEPWLIEQERFAMEAAFARAAAPRREGACPLLAEVLAPGATGPLAEALTEARRGGLRGSGVPEALRRAIEGDLTLQCAGRVAVPLLYAADARVAAEALAEMLVHVPQEIGAGQLAMQSELALVLGRRDQADQLAIAAAAASADPRRVWRRAAAMAALVDARHHELLALRQAVMHGPGAAEADALRLRLVVRGLRDADDAWAPRNAPAGREALLRSVDSYLAELPPARRWHAREALAWALAEYEWRDAEAAELVRAAVWQNPVIARLHPAGLLRLERALGGPEPTERPSPFAPAEWAAHLAPRRALGAGKTGPAGQPDGDEKTGPEGQAEGLPRETEVFCPVDSLQTARLYALRRAPPGPARLRAAIAAAVTGDGATRKQALRVLLAEVEPARREAVVDALIAGLAAATVAGPAPMVADDDDLLALVFGIERDPARRRPEIKGQ
jgi:hypothetical protein